MADAPFACQCNGCGTVFRVVPDQVRVRGGRVRCGLCGTLFDALAARVGMPEAPVVAADEAADRAAPAVLRGREAFVSAPPAASVAGEDAGDDAVSAPLPDPGSSAADAVDDAPLFAGPPPVSAPPPAFLAEPSRSRRSAWAGWAAGIVLLLLLALQAVWWFRMEIVRALPAARAPLAAVCDALGCEVPHARDASLLVVESSALTPWPGSELPVPMPGGDPAAAASAEWHEAEPADPAARRMALTLAIRNRAPFAQPWPAIELALTDFSDAVVARRILLPAMYLAPSDLAGALPAASSRILTIPVDTHAPHATGYRLELFHP